MSLIENHPPGTMAKLQFDYENVCKVNPNIIYCASSSYGTKGPYANMPSNDPMMQLAAGFASLNGSPGSQGEMFRYVASVDYTTSLNIVQAVLLALMARQVTGQGQKIEMSQFEATLALADHQDSGVLCHGKSPMPMGTANPNIVPVAGFPGPTTISMSTSACTGKSTGRNCAKRWDLPISRRIRNTPPTRTALRTGRSSSPYWRRNSPRSLPGGG